MANIDDIISLDRIINNPAYDFLNQLMTSNDKNDNDDGDVHKKFSPYENVESNCIVNTLMNLNS
jgi:hypothetical protein